jgi:iron complex transport system ATP-binding protein
MSDTGTRNISFGKPETVLACKGLEFGFGGDPFLFVNELAVQAGELVGLLGPNGAGKSTCLRVLAGLLTPRSGVVYICGHLVDRLSPQERARLIAWVPQRSETPFEWTVLEMVSMGRHPYLGRRLTDREPDRQIVQSALERVGIGPLAERPVGTLSGGEWQRALVARALAQEARVLLLDEPVASLDLGYQRQIYELVREMCHEQGIAVLAADHHVDLQAIFCDRLILMNRGRVAAQGTPEEVLRSTILEAVYQTPLTVQQDAETGRPSVRWRFRGD